MANLILVEKNDEIINLNEKEIHPEEEIERMIFDNKNILPDVHLLKRQLITYTKEDRIDLVGIDNENKIVVIEVKDEPIDESVIPQVLRYAVWVETHPDAIKSIWLEQKNGADDFTFDWDKELEVRIIIVGPSFRQSVQRLINRIRYSVDLVEFKKFVNKTNVYIFLNAIETEGYQPFKPVDTTRDYNENFYLKNYNSTSARDFWKISNELEQYINERGWNLKRSNNKGYISFKNGYPVVFGITFIGSKSFALFFKIPKNVADNISIPGINMTRYEEQWNQAIFKIETSEIVLKKFTPLFDAAYKCVVGE